MKPAINNKIKKNPSFYKVTVLYTTVLILLSACNTTNRAPIRERQQPPTTKIFQHVVAPGETLYSIAWRYGLDYKRLASINGIDSGFVIHPGEVLDLRTNKRYFSHRNKQRYVVPVESSASPSVTQRSSKRVGAPVDIKANQPSSISSPTSINSTRKKRSATGSVATKTVGRHITWQWPITGPIISRFSGSKGLNKGIDIKARTGDKVAAAASGSVVYAGSGLRGYGKLLIIKHNDIFLSAYGHNSRLRVKEGDTVNAGQHIADAGATGASTSKLHFEIRREGEPVNPLNYLPK